MNVKVVCNINKDGLFEAIAHGDYIHRAWLKEAIDAYFSGRPVPPPILSEDDWLSNTKE